MVLVPCLVSVSLVCVTMSDIHCFLVSAGSNSLFLLLQGRKDCETNVVSNFIYILSFLYIVMNK